jgi:hypothetical protein
MTSTSRSEVQISFESLALLKKRLSILAQSIAFPSDSESVWKTSAILVVYKDFVWYILTESFESGPQYLVVTGKVD